MILQTIFQDVVSQMLCLPFYDLMKNSICVFDFFYLGNATIPKISLKIPEIQNLKFRTLYLP